jgi:hypothetical protein
MAELGFTKANLPSRGALYEGKVPDGEVEVRKLTANEEALLLSSGSQGMDRMETVLQRCVRLPNEFPHDELLMTDRMASLLALRTITFGPHYSFDYRCRFCSQMQKAEIDILEDLEEQTPDSIAVKMLDKGHEDWQLHEPLTITLPDKGMIIDVRFLRGKDEQKIVKRSKRVAMQSVDVGDPSYLYRFALQIVRVEGEEVDLGKKELFVRELTAKDTAAIRIAVDEVEPGIDLTVYPECRNCGAVNEMMLPFTVEFFRPSRL